MTVDLVRTRERFPVSHHKLLDNLSRILSALDQMTLAPSVFRDNPHPVKFFNSYVDFAIALYIAKFQQLYSAMASALEDETYLIYAAAGRAILENGATLRYYARHQDFATLQNAWGTPEMSDSILRRAISTLDRLCRGSRFTWDAFMESRFDELGSKGPEDPLSQVSVTTCLEKWYREKPKLRPLYALFCDLVHPNVGSNLLVLRSVDGQLVSGGAAGSFKCQFIVLPTLAGILGTYNTIQEAWKDLEAARLPPSSGA
jgi:hypothetical protein